MKRKLTSDEYIDQVRRKLKDCVTYLRHGKITSPAKKPYTFRDQRVVCEACGAKKSAAWVFYFDDDNVSIDNINICKACAKTVDEAVNLMSIAVIKRDLAS